MIINILPGWSVAILAVHSASGAGPLTSVPPKQMKPSTTEIQDNKTVPSNLAMDCNQAYVPLTSTSSSNTTLAACKSLSSPDAAFCRTAACDSKPTCNTCNKILPNGPDDTIILSNETVISLECHEYYLSELTGKSHGSVCTDAKDENYLCTGTCENFTRCRECVNMKDHAAQTFTARG